MNTIQYDYNEVAQVNKLNYQESRIFNTEKLTYNRIRKIDLISNIVLSVDYASVFIEKLFKCETPQYPVRLQDFILNLMNRTRLTTGALITAFLYLDRLKKMHPKCKGSPGSGYRLLLSAIILAAKYMFDDTYDNSAWATVSSGMFKLVQVNHMEREMLYFLDFNLFITPEEWYAFYNIIEQRVYSSQ